MGKYIFDDSNLELLERSCIPYAIFQLLEGRVTALLVSDGFCDLFDTDRENAIDQLNNHTYDVDHPDDVARLGEAGLAFAIEGKDYDVVYRTSSKKGYKIIHSRGKHIYTKSGERLAVIWYIDEGMYQDDNKSVYDQAVENTVRSTVDVSGHNYDSVTGLPVTNYFFKVAEVSRNKILESGKDAVLLYIDFNEMRNYNIKYGFLEGDRLLMGLAKVLVSHFSNINCCRFGSDRFVVISEDTDIEKKLAEIFEETKSLNGGRSLTLRVGIYKHSQGDYSVGIACDRAKMAADMTKDRFKSTFNYYDESMLNAARQRQYVLENLDTAIRRGWIQVYYQPIIRSANGRVSDEEALARWIDPIMGFLSPAQFVPVLEDSKQIYKLDLFVLDQVLEKIKTIEENGLHVVPCSINISRSDFEMCDIVEEIRKRVDASGVSRDKITIEITESTVATNMEHVSQQVSLLKELGFVVWLDDYGSGYSSPDILQSMPFGTIKLDMQFMRKFDESEKCKIIISEIINMALNLGLETVVEGVETEEQVEFLREVGATKLQGYYYCRPIPLEEVLKRYKTGAQIGFENPLECEYFEAIGKVNLYNLSIMAGEFGEGDMYFNTLPMAIFEVDNDTAETIRCNRACRAVLKKNFKAKECCKTSRIVLRDDTQSRELKKALIKCGQTGYQMIEDQRTPDDKIAHTLFKRLAVNPVTGKRAIAIIFLEIKDINKKFDTLTYANVALALSTDYLALYYVNKETENFVEYKTNAGSNEMVVERQGKDFFESSREDAFLAIHEEDREGFINTFNREIVLGYIEKYGNFTYTYRLKTGDDFIYVKMKATSIGRNHIIIGINNVDVQMREREALKRIDEERIAFSRISALAGTYIVFYSVNPADNSYKQFDANNEYKELGVSREGNDFFADSIESAKKAIYSEDYEKFAKGMQKEHILKEIEERGVFSMTYRLMISGKPRYVTLKAKKIEEKGNEFLLFGVNDVDTQVKKDQEYAYNLAVARNKWGIDSLTGVKNKNAFNESENMINEAIRSEGGENFAIVVFDINNLKEVNDKKGHSAGDELIKKGCRLICDVFAHSPVFRIGGDEFAALVRGSDYENLDELMQNFYLINLENKKSGDVVVAAGAAKYQGDRYVEDVFKRADAEMYENKKLLKKL
ncbi:MAG: EAL domain-containing protein [Lachnospiraceae bacterium]|nr:EAL domain-containing protein [Lachnospiraceae bacterium]